MPAVAGERDDFAFEVLKQRLEHIYEVAVEHRVDDFITSDAALVDRLSPGDRRDEQLLVREAEDQLDLSLYLDRKLVSRLRRDDPTARLHAGNWADFCTALEGVSHFLYLVWNAERRRSVRPVELEMQAEVDKYILSVSLYSGQRDGRVPPRLHPQLFDDFELLPGLSAPERQRYRDANRYAGRYCRFLEQRYLHGGADRRGAGARRESGILSELRRFYRLPLRQKIDRIEKTHRH